MQRAIKLRRIVKLLVPDVYNAFPGASPNALSVTVSALPVSRSTGPRLVCPTPGECPPRVINP